MQRAFLTHRIITMTVSTILCMVSRFSPGFLHQLSAGQMMSKITVSPDDTSDTYDTPEYWKPISSANVSLPNFTFPFAFGQRATDYALNGVLIAVLIIVMISLGCTMEISKIKANFWKPKGVAIAVVAQYGIMPLTALALGKLFQLDSIEALAVLICGCCPGGNLSNIFSLASKGDMNLR